MNKFLAVLSGALIAVMIAVNGLLGDALGGYASSVIIHGVGLCAIVLLLVVRRISLRGTAKHPWILYTGGIIGVFTVLGNILTVTRLDVSLTLALGLLGQLLASLLVDHFGLLGAQRQPFQPRRLAGLALIAAGTAAMLFW